MVHHLSHHATTVVCAIATYYHCHHYHHATTVVCAIITYYHLKIFSYQFSLTRLLRMVLCLLVSTSGAI